MPGLVLFGRRWAIGSDDFVLPALTFAALHAIWCVASFSTVLVSIFTVPTLDGWLYQSLLSFNVVLAVCQLMNATVDLVIAKISSAGSVLDESDRGRLPGLLYIRFGVLAINVLATVGSVAWLCKNYRDASADGSLKKCLLATVVWQFISTLAVLSLMWGSYDSVGKQWLLLKRFEDRSQHNGRIYKRSTTRRRTWRRRKVLLAYQDSWRKRLRIMAGCIGATEDDKTALTEAAKLFTEFFHELDVVPSDLLAGFVLLRRQQKYKEKETMEKLGRNISNRGEAHRILSGAITTPKTVFMDFGNQNDAAEIRTLRYYMQYALAAYGWPFYLTNNKYGRLCELLLHVRLFPRPSLVRHHPVVREDNCFHCNSTAVKLTLPRAYVTLIYACWHCHIGQTPFYVAVDHREKAVVVCVRGTMSMNDFITDFNAHPENIPLIDPRPSPAYQAHRGMIVAAVYVFQKLKSEWILDTAFSRAGPGYKLIIVGHSLGGGAATILAMLLRPTYPDLHCFVYAPPGGLLTREAVELSRTYVTTLIVGKDLVARLALAQMELMRAELVRLLTLCTVPKWRIICETMGCCGSSYGRSCSDLPLDQETLLRRRCHITLRTASTTSPPMFPPGNLIHIVRSWSEERRRGEKPHYVAIRADNADFNEILISPVMIHDHMPDGIIEALDGLLEQIDYTPRHSSPIVTVPTINHANSVSSFGSCPDEELV